MRLLRFLALVVILAAVYFAQYIFDYRSLADFFPDRVLQAVPALAQYTRWLTNDLLLLGLALAGLAGLAFGLLAPPWRGALDARQDRDPWATPPRRSIPARALLPLGLGLIGVSAAGLLLWLTGSETPASTLLWLVSAALFIGGTVLLDRQAPQPQSTAPAGRRIAGGLIGITLLAALLFGWQLAALPSQIDSGLAEFSVEALRGRNLTTLFTPSAQGLPRLAYAASALLMQIGQNILLEMRLAGLLAGVATVAATWLLAAELFRRTPVHGPDDELIEGDGRWMAGVAAVTLTITLATLHFARLPFYIEPVAWGVTGLWLLLRGWRRDAWTLLGLGGALIGLAMVISPVGLVFGATGLLWWAGVLLFDPDWMAPGQRLRRWGVWCGGLWLFLGPLLGSWLYAPARFTAHVQAPARLDATVSTPGAALFGLNLRRTLTAFNYTADTSAVFAYPDHLLHSLLAPLLILAVGALLLNIDTWAGWTLLAWGTAGALIVAWLSPRAPFAPLMLPLLPAAALALAFAFDRLRVALLRDGGPWLEQTTVILVAGLLVWVGINSWLRYYPFAARAGDAASEIARTAHASADAPTLLIVVGPAGEALSWRDAPLLLVQSDLPRAQTRDAIRAPNWPISLPAGARLLLQPPDRALLDDLAQRYPGGVTTVQRDLAGNPVAYVYEVR